jgi:hypothetical protein
MTSPAATAQTSLLLRRIPAPALLSATPEAHSGRISSAASAASNQGR